MNTEKTSDNVM